MYTGRDMPCGFQFRLTHLNGISGRRALTGQWDDPLVGSDALCLLVKLAILVPVKAVIPIGNRGGESF